MIIEISVAVIALAFAALVVFLIAFIRSLQVTLGQVNHTLSESRKQLDQLALEAKKMMEHTTEISADIQHKIESLDPLFRAVEDLGNIAESKTASLKTHLISPAKKSTEPLESPKDRQLIAKDVAKVISDTIDLIGHGHRLWHNLKQRR